MCVEDKFQIISIISCLLLQGSRTRRKAGVSQWHWENKLTGFCNRENKLASFGNLENELTGLWSRKNKLASIAGRQKQLTVISKVKTIVKV